MLWIYNLPLWTLCTLCILVSVTISLTGVLFARRRGWTLGPEETSTAFAVHAFVGVVYAVSLGLIVVGVQSSFNDVQKAVIDEASKVSDLYRSLEGIEDPKRTELQQLIHRYVERIINNEWPDAQQGRINEFTTQTMDSIARDVFTYAPQNTHSQLIYPQLVADATALLDARRERVFLGAQGVGPVIWTIVLIGAFITLGFAWFFHAPSVRAHLIMVGIMSAMFGLMMFLIVGLDHPLWGRMGVDPGPFQTVQRNLERWDAARETTNTSLSPSQ